MAATGAYEFIYKMTTIYTAPATAAASSVLPYWAFRDRTYLRVKDTVGWTGGSLLTMAISSHRASHSHLAGRFSLTSFHPPEPSWDDLMQQFFRHTITAAPESSCFRGLPRKQLKRAFASFCRPEIGLLCTIFMRLFVSLLFTCTRTTTTREKEEMKQLFHTYRIFSLFSQGSSKHPSYYAAAKAHRTVCVWQSGIKEYGSK